MSLLERHRSSLIIAAVALLLCLWVLSGVLFREPPPRSVASRLPSP